MSLLDDAMETFIYMNKSMVDDGLGGTKTVYSEGASIKGALSFNNSPESQIAQALGSTNMYQFIVRKENQLDYHDVLKRASNGAYFRITNNADDNKTPKSAMLNMRVYTAEEWSME